ncbi:hypothetical protein ACFQ2T_08075 [Methylophilus flavus]|uniref:Integrase n=1 Tax=Methylophilus flavus TaxID=640084 RepID=A0ABW3P8B1_9PROT
MTLSTRKTVIYDLPFPQNAAILKPEAVKLRFPNRRTTDIGAICYLKRESGLDGFQSDRGRFDGQRVDMDTFSPDRAKLVIDLMDHISDELKLSGKRPETIRDSVARFLAFMFWADTNDFQNVLSSAETAKFAVRAYIRHLRERVMTNSISINGAARQQSTVADFIGRFLGVDDLTRGFSLLRVNPATKEITNPPSENAQARVLRLCEALFDGLGTFVLENKPYPLALIVPTYLSYPEGILWIFPSTTWSISQDVLANGSLKRSLGYNFKEGRLSTLEELLCTKRFSDNRQAAHNAINSAKRQLHKANADKSHTQRKRLGMNALHSFILLFLAQTGMNWAQVITLQWTDDYDVGATHQGFRTIKWRADNKSISFELPVSFMPRFREYLQLRKFLLGDQTSSFLFFTLGLNVNSPPTQYQHSSTGHIYNMLRRIDPEITPVTSREWRAAKSDWLIRNTDISTAALVLQNTEKTVLAHYAAGSEAAQIEEIGGFFNKISEMVIDKVQIAEGGVDRAVGYCSSYGAPNIVNAAAPIQPDCKALEGCFFCEKYRVHADETDTRKLISCRYCLQQTIQFSGSDETQFKLIPIFEKIEEALSEISLRDKDLVIRITKEVQDDGKLDPYWARKLEMLMEIGLAG